MKNSLIALALLAFALPSEAQDVMHVDSIATVIRVPLKHQPLSERPIWNQKWYANRARKRIYNKEHDRYEAMYDSVCMEYGKWLTELDRRFNATHDVYNYNVNGTNYRVTVPNGNTYVAPIYKKQ